MNCFNDYIYIAVEWKSSSNNSEECDCFMPRFSRQCLGTWGRWSPTSYLYYWHMTSWLLRAIKVIFVTC